jgi:hypothetical protein
MSYFVNRTIELQEKARLLEEDYRKKQEDLELLERELEEIADSSSPEAIKLTLNIRRVDKHTQGRFEAWQQVQQEIDRYVSILTEEQLRLLQEHRLVVKEREEKSKIPYLSDEEKAHQPQSQLEMRAKYEQNLAICEDYDLSVRPKLAMKCPFEKVQQLVADEILHLPADFEDLHKLGWQLGEYLEEREVRNSEADALSSYREAQSDLGKMRDEVKKYADFDFTRRYISVNGESIENEQWRSGWNAIKRYHTNLQSRLDNRQMLLDTLQSERIAKPVKQEVSYLKRLLTENDTIYQRWRQVAGDKEAPPAPKPRQDDGIPDFYRRNFDGTPLQFDGFFVPAPSTDKKPTSDDTSEYQSTTIEFSDLSSEQ